MTMDPTAGPNIVVIGASCAGKSTFARRVADRLGTRLVELDALWWQPGWRPSEAEDFRERIDAETGRGRDGWVVAGNYRNVTRELVWPRAHVIVWLDLPLGVVMRRMVTRTWRRWRTNELLWGTNRERLWDQFLPMPSRSLFVFTLTTFRRRRREFEAEARHPRWSHIEWVRLRSAHEADQWLDALKPAVAPQRPG